MLSYSASALHLNRVTASHRYTILGQRVQHASDTNLLSLLQTTFNSLYWFSYRSNIEPLFNRTGQRLLSDAGWGCMLRAAQMLLANALARQLNVQGGAKERQLLRSFADSAAAAYSLHAIAGAGVRHGKGIGEWFGPQLASSAVRDVVNGDEERALTVYVARDGVVYCDAVDELCGDGPCLILVPNRLGLDKLNDMYISQIATLLDEPHSVGAVGGRTNGARYFCGTIARDTEASGALEYSVMYLDPHSVHATVDMSGDEFDCSTYHNDSIAYMALQNIDPSVAFGFHCVDKADREQLFDTLRESIASNAFPVLSVVQETPQWLDQDAKQVQETEAAEDELSDLLLNGPHKKSSLGFEEFEMV